MVESKERVEHPEFGEAGLEEQNDHANGFEEDGVLHGQDAHAEKLDGQGSHQQVSHDKRFRERLYALKFAGILCLVCCSLITGASVGLQGMQRENMAVDRQKNILKAAGILSSDASVSSDEIKSLYQEMIEEILVNEAGDIVSSPSHDREASFSPSSGASELKNGGAMEETGGNGGSLPSVPSSNLPLYLYKTLAKESAESETEIKAYIIPIESRGLWGKIKGYLAFENDGMTVAGFTVYSHAETPGLGGEIEKAWFGKNFVGKKIVNSAGEFVSVSIAKGDVESLSEEKQKHYVDGISGATLTGKYLSQGLRKNLERYEGVSIKFRQTHGKKGLL